MFKGGRWRSEKNRAKTSFKLQFYATQVPQSGWDALMLSLVPSDAGKPSARSEKAAVRGGVCRWENPLYEIVRFSQDSKTGKTHGKIYRISVQNAASRGSILGEIALDFANYAEAVKPSSVSLALKPASSGAILHVTITRMQATVDGREEENGKSQGRTLRSQLSIDDMDESSEAAYDSNNCNYRDNSSITDQPELTVSHSKPTSQNGFCRASSGCDVMSSSSLDSGSEQNTPRRSNNTGQDGVSFLSSLSNNSASLNPTEHRKSNTEWSLSSGPDGSTHDSTNSSENTLTKDRSQSSDVSIEKLKNELIVMARQAELTELELQTLRKQVVKESKRGQDLSKKIRSLKEERDAIKNEFEQLRASPQKMNQPHFDNGDQQHILDEIRQELSYEKDLNANLRLQLQKTQESNSELILAVRDLEELLEEKCQETKSSSSNPTGARLDDKDCDEKDYGIGFQLKSNREEDARGKHEMESDEDQAVLEEIVREQKVMDLSCEIEVYKKDREELEMQMEQLVLDYEILKQENHEMISRLRQSELHRQLRIQYESSESLAVTSDLEAQLEKLEKELEKQAKTFEVDLAELAHEKVEHEQRAIRAEEALRKMKWNNACTAVRLQEEFRRLSVQMASTFEANEKLALKAQAEATEIRLQKCHLESLLEKANEEHALLKEQYEEKLGEISKQLDLKSKEMDRLRLELGETSQKAQNLKKYVEEREKVLMEKLQKQQTEMEAVTGEKNKLSELLQQKEMSTAELDRMKKWAEEERDTLLKRGIVERDALKELNEMQQVNEENEILVSRLQFDLEKLRSQYNNLKQSLFEEKLEKENLQKQVLHLKGDLQKKEATVAIIQKKLKENIVRATVSDGTAKASSKNSNKSGPPSRLTKEVANLREKVKALEEKLKLREAALQNSTHSFLEKEKDLCNKIEELQKVMTDLSQNDAVSQEDKCQDGKDSGRTVAFNGSNGELIRRTIGTSIEEMKAANHSNNIEFLREMTLLQERNKTMEMELKEMQERYSEISLRFAEVEGERQQLVMTVRNLRNAKKS